MNRRDFIVTAAVGAAAVSCKPMAKQFTTDLGVYKGGIFDLFRVQAPAIGNGATYNVGDAFALQLLCVQFVLTTGAAAANRFATVGITGLGFTNSITVSGQAQIISLVREYSFGYGYGQFTVGDILMNVPLPLVIVPPGGRISINAQNLNALDQFSAVTITGFRYPLN